MRYLLATWLLALLPPTRAFALKRAALRALGIAVGDGTRVCGRVAFFGGGRVTIGRDCWIGIGTVFYTAHGGDVTIGDACDIAPEVCFHTGSHALGGPERRAGPGTAAPIAVGDGCWLGTRATVLAGVEIGAASVIAAGGMVTSSQPAGTLAAGVPARTVRAL
jgi:maltose O-acetyltransferase